MSVFGKHDELTRKGRRRLKAMGEVDEIQVYVCRMVHEVRYWHTMEVP